MRHLLLRFRVHSHQLNKPAPVGNGRLPVHHLVGQGPIVTRSYIVGILFEGVGEHGYGIRKVTAVQEFNAVLKKEFSRVTTAGGHGEAQYRRAD